MSPPRRGWSCDFTVALPIDKPLNVVRVKMPDDLDDETRARLDRAFGLLEAMQTLGDGLEEAGWLLIDGRV